VSAALALITGVPCLYDQRRESQAGCIACPGTGARRLLPAFRRDGAVADSGSWHDATGRREPRGDGCTDPRAHGRADDAARAHVRTDPQADDTLCGPVISAKQRDRVVGYIRKGVDEGARLVVGGPEAPDGLETGFFVKPSLFVDVDNSMTIAREEIFGPVLVIIPYEDDDDAVRIANDSSYGLAGFVISNDLERSQGVGRRLRAGTVGLNGGAAIGADVPFGGYKDSGVGRQNGTAGFAQYLEVKSVAWPAG